MPQVNHQILGLGGGGEAFGRAGAARASFMVGGGSTANMLAVWRVRGFDRILREAWEAGIVLAASPLSRARRFRLP
jgi:Peptidase family S51